MLLLYPCLTKPILTEFNMNYDLMENFMFREFCVETMIKKFSDDEAYYFKTEKFERRYCQQIPQNVLLKEPKSNLEIFNNLLFDTFQVFKKNKEEHDKYMSEKNILKERKSEEAEKKRLQQVRQHSEVLKKINDKMTMQHNMREKIKKEKNEAIEKKKKEKEKTDEQVNSIKEKIKNLFSNRLTITTKPQRKFWLYKLTHTVLEGFGIPDLNVKQNIDYIKEITVSDEILLKTVELDNLEVWEYVFDNLIHLFHKFKHWSKFKLNGGLSVILKDYIFLIQSRVFNFLTVEDLDEFLKSDCIITNMHGDQLLEYNPQLDRKLIYKLKSMNVDII